LGVTTADIHHVVTQMSLYDTAVVADIKKIISKFLNRETDIAQAAVVVKRAENAMSKGIDQNESVRTIVSDIRLIHSPKPFFAKESGVYLR
jgi:hypothetical protein